MYAEKAMSMPSVLVTMVAQKGKAGSHGQAANQNRPRIDQKITDQEEEIRPAHCLERLWNRLDAVGLNGPRMGNSSFCGFHFASLILYQYGWSSTLMVIGQVAIGA